MLVPVIATILVMSAVTADTVVTLGILERDLTGDAVPEVLSLTGIGQTVDSLDVTFLIQSSGRTLYKTTWPMTRTVGFDAGRRTLSDAELHARLQEFGGWFFDEAKFMSPEGFVAKLRDQGPRHVGRIPRVIARDRGFAPGRHETPSDLSRAAAIWEEMRASGVTVFEFSTGGDAVTAIAWSPAEERFYRLLECC